MEVTSAAHPRFVSGQILLAMPALEELRSLLGDLLGDLCVKIPFLCFVRFVAYLLIVELGLRLVHAVLLLWSELVLAILCYCKMV